MNIYSLTPKIEKTDSVDTDYIDFDENSKNLASKKLSPDLKKSITLVLMGNFMEYFDLMLGVHLSIVLNHVFLPQDTGYEHILRPLTAIPGCFF